MVVPRVVTGPARRVVWRSAGKVASRVVRSEQSGEERGEKGR